MAIAASDERPVRVAFINPASEDNMRFWTDLTEYMQKAARDLKIDLQVHYANYNRFEAVRLAEKITAQTPKPDYLVHIYYRGQENQIFKIADKAKIHSFTINAPVPLEERRKLGKPRQRYPYWLGEMTPNDEQAGFLLASFLIQHAQEMGLSTESQKIHLLAMTANKESEIASQRNRGLSKAINTYSNAELEQFVLNDWGDENTVSTKLEVLVDRYKDLSIIWSASDSIALSVIEKLPKLGITPGNHLIVGGIDGTKNALRQIQKGRLAASAIGHSLEGAWALVLLYDHFHGKDFSHEYLQSHTRYDLATSKNVDEYLKLALDDDKGGIDFRQFSKRLNPKLSQYQFSLENLLLTRHPPAQRPRVSSER